MTTKTAPEPKTARDLLRRCCVFCGKSVKEVKKMIESQNTGAMICDECIGLCVEILSRG